MRIKTLHPFLMRAAVTLAVMMIIMMVFPTEAQAQTATKVSTWVALKTAVEAATTTNPVSIELEGDIERSANYQTIAVSGTVTIDLHGHKINGMEKSGNIFYMSTGELTITDATDAKKGEISGAWGSANISIDGTVEAGNPGKVTLEAGIIGGPTSGVTIANSGSFTMTGGTISGSNTGVDLGDSSSFTMTGGTITGNSTGVNIVSSSATMTVSGNVTISGNTTKDVSLYGNNGLGCFSTICIGGDLSEGARIGVCPDLNASTDDVIGKPLTSGLKLEQGEDALGSAANFFINGRSDLGIVVEGNELYFGQLMATNVAVGSNWCSYYNDSQLMRACSGVTAYKANLNAAKMDVELTELFTDGGVILNGQGVLLKSDGDIVLMKTNDAADYSLYEGNELKGVDEDKDQGANDGKCYVLSKVGETFGFFLLETGVQLGAHKAYLIVEPSSAGSRGFLGIGDETTGIVDANFKFASQESRISNSLQRGDAWYSLDGRRLSGEPTRKGVYVRDGKKFVIK